MSDPIEWTEDDTVELTVPYPDRHSWVIRSVVVNLVVLVRDGLAFRVERVMADQPDIVLGYVIEAHNPAEQLRGWTASEVLPDEHPAAGTVQVAGKEVNRRIHEHPVQAARDLGTVTSEDTVLRTSEKTSIDAEYDFEWFARLPSAQRYEPAEPLPTYGMLNEWPATGPVSVGDVVELNAGTLTCTWVDQAGVVCKGRYDHRSGERRTDTYRIVGGDGA